jgi:hypothetical protein
MNGKIAGCGNAVGMKMKCVKIKGEPWKVVKKFDESEESEDKHEVKVHDLMQPWKPKCMATWNTRGGPLDSLPWENKWHDCWTLWYPCGKEELKKIVDSEQSLHQYIVGQWNERSERSKKEEQQSRKRKR